MKNGVFFHGNPWSYESHPDQKLSQCIFAGELVYDAKETCFSKPKVKLCIRYRKGAYVNCFVFNDKTENDAAIYYLARSLQAGDYVFGVGTYYETTYKTKHNETKVSYGVNVSFLLPFTLISDPRTFIDVMTHTDGEKPQPFIKESAYYAGIPRDAENGENGELGDIDTAEWDEEEKRIPNF